MLGIPGIPPPGGNILTDTRLLARTGDAPSRRPIVRLATILEGLAETAVIVIVIVIVLVVVVVVVAIVHPRALKDENTSRAPSPRLPRSLALARARACAGTTRGRFEGRRARIDVGVSLLMSHDP
jgi:hypothetical protein